MPETLAVETEAPAATVEAPVPQSGRQVEPTTTPTEPEPAPASAAEPTVAQLQAALEAERAKTARAVAAEQTARAKRQELEGQLTTFQTEAATREAERVTNLSLSEKLAEETAKREAAEAAALTVTKQWADFRVETELGAAGFLSGLEGEAKTAQLQTLKALTSLDLVKEDGAFSIAKFSERFGGLRPKDSVLQEIVAPAVTVVDVGAPGGTPAGAAPTQKAELVKARDAAMERGDRLAVIQLTGQIAQLRG